MKKFEGILICTDLDGTLLSGDRTISRENSEAIEYFKSEGGAFTFITGRPPVTSKGICKMVAPNAPFGCLNGGGLYDHVNGRYLWYEETPRSCLELVEEVYQKLDCIGIQVNTLDKIWFSRENLATEWFCKATAQPALRKNHFDVDEPIAKIVFCDLDPENIRKLSVLLHSHPRADEFGFIRSEKTLYEILPKGINKGSVLPKLCEYLGIDIRRSIAVGDYDNDVGMLKAAGIGIAVSNASEAAKTAADMITVSNEESAIAKIIYDIEAGRILFD